MIVPVPLSIFELPFFAIFNGVSLLTLLSYTMVLLCHLFIFDNAAGVSKIMSHEHNLNACAGNAGSHCMRDIDIMSARRNPHNYLVIIVVVSI